MSHIFGAKNKTLSVPYLTKFARRLVRKLFPLKLLKLEEDTNEAL